MGEGGKKNEGRKERKGNPAPPPSAGRTTSLEGVLPAVCTLFSFPPSPGSAFLRTLASSRSPTPPAPLHPRCGRAGGGGPEGSRGGGGGGSRSPAGQAAPTPLNFCRSAGEPRAPRASLPGAEPGEWGRGGSPAGGRRWVHTAARAPRRPRPGSRLAGGLCSLARSTTCAGATAGGADAAGPRGARARRASAEQGSRGLTTPSARVLPPTEGELQAGQGQVPHPHPTGPPPLQLLHRFLDLFPVNDGLGGEGVGVWVGEGP